MPATGAQCRVRKSAGKQKRINKLRQLNKKKIDTEKKKEEEEAKHKKDEEEALKKAEEELAKTTEEDEVAKNLHKIMNGTDKDKDKMNVDVDEDKEDQSPVKKRGGSSKSTMKRATRKSHKASPQETHMQGEVAPSILNTTFNDTFIYLYKRIVIELAITLTKEDTFNKLAKALAALLSNAQIVDPNFGINPIDPTAKEKDIAMKGDISTNMTKLGIHVKISRNGHTFLKQKIWDKDKGKKFSKKKEEYCHPTVYFPLDVSSAVDPKEIIERCLHEWMHIGGTRMNIKDLQDINSKTVVTLFKVSMSTRKGVILAELKKILTKVQMLVQDKSGDITKYYFSMEMDMVIGKTLLAFNLRVQNAKLRGQEVSIFNKLSKRAQMAHKKWHIEMACKHASNMKELVQYVKDSGCAKKAWGKHAHLTKVTDLSSNLRETKKQVNLAQSHTNYQMSMMAKDLIGAITLDKILAIIHPASNTIISTFSLQDVLLYYLKMSDGHSMIAEVHQEDITKPTTIIIPITSEAKRMALPMNKTLPAFLWHMLRE